MKKYHINLFVSTCAVILTFNQTITANDYLQQDTIKRFPTVSKLNIEQPDTALKKNKASTEKSILDILDGLDKNKRVIAWKLDPITFNLEEVLGIDTSLFFQHFEVPLHRKLETTTYLGNIGSPIKSDNYFNQHSSFPFLFSRYFLDYSNGVIDHYQYNIKRPLTNLSYSMGGKRSQIEQTLKVLHTQNINKFFNVGLDYKYFGTKGTYKNQQTRDNFFNAFASYYREKFSMQTNFAYFHIRNKENGGLVSDYSIRDTIIETELIPFRLKGAESEVRQRSFSTVLGYELITHKVKSTSPDGQEISVRKPIFTVKGVFNANKYTRTYVDGISDDTSHFSFYENFYINKSNSHDSVMLVNYESTLLGEITQIAKWPGLPGIRFWISDTRGRYYYFKPTDFILTRDDDKINTNHFGVAAFSYSPYLTYSGALRLYLNGYKAGDKEIFGKILISPWKSNELPYVKGRIEITERHPDIFINNYFSNHYKWSNSFNKEKRFLLGGSIGAEKWRLEAGYNIIHISDFIYFDTLGVPAQADKVTITSAYLQKDLKLGGLHFTNRLVWQANTNQDVLSLPTFSVFSSLFFEYELVKKVLVGQIGVNMFYRTKFYADSYSPATGQFYNQRVTQIGEYPYLDAFIDFKWKRAILYFKYDHVNQGVSNNEYFATLHYPFNRRILKIGVSWIFYD